MLQFDEPRLITNLRALPRESRAAFALACARRLLNACAQRVSARSEIELLNRAIAAVENSVVNQPEAAVLAGLEVHLLQLANENMALDPVWEDAVACVIYTIRAATRGDPVDSALAARRCYEAVSEFVLQALDLEPSPLTSEQSTKLRSFVEEELKRQERDVDVLRGLGERVGIGQVCEQANEEVLFSAVAE